MCKFIKYQYEGDTQGELFTGYTNIDSLKAAWKVVDENGKGMLKIRTTDIPKSLIHIERPEDIKRIVSLLEERSV